MAVELMGAKLLAPFYGSSLYVWTAVLGITVLGLAMGYFFGGLVSVRKSVEILLIIILGVAALLVFAFPYTAKAVIFITSGMGLIPGICVSSILLLVPPVFCFGLVGPIVVRLMSSNAETVGNVAGTVYFTSTLGGILATFLFGYILIPEAGLRFSALITGIALAMLPLLYLITKSGSKSESFQPESLPSTLAKRGHPSGGLGKVQRKVETQQVYLSFYVFAAIEGATVMAAELMSARMLAPWFGGSLYVWVAVIGITLLSLALGYFAGGRLAELYPGVATILWVLLISSIFLMLMPFLSEHLILLLHSMDLRIGAVLVSLVFVLPPLLCLGMIPTLLIRYLTTNVDDAGTTTGRVFTISSASGIVALPIMGFFVIPQFGLTGPSILIGLLVGIIPLIKLVAQKKFLALVLPVALVFSLSQRSHVKSTPDIKVHTFSEGLLGQVLVADVFKNGAGQVANDRLLFINRMAQTAVDKSSLGSKWNYLIFSSAVASILPEKSKALVLGLGGGSLANNFAKSLNFQVDAIELDSRISDAARKYFALSPEVSVVIDDARHYLETTEKRYDLILFDVFKGDVQPPHVLSLECFIKAKSLLNPNGLIIVNFHGFLTGEVGKPGRSVYATLHAAGLDTRIFPTPGKEEDRNTLFISTVGPRMFSQVRSPLMHSGAAVDIDSLFLDISTLNILDAVVFTDNKPDLDRLNLKANTIWRKSYNSSYSRFFLDSGLPLFN